MSEEIGYTAQMGQPIFDRPSSGKVVFFSGTIETIQFTSNCTVQNLARQGCREEGKENDEFS